MELTELTEGEFYHFKFRTTVANGKTFDWEIAGKYGGSGMTAGGRPNYTICILPQTHLDIIFPDRDELIEVASCDSTFTETVT